MSLSAAKSRVRQARDQIETGRIDDVEPTLAAAEGFLTAVSAEEAAPLAAQIAAMREELRGLLTPADRTRISAAQGKLRQAADQRAMHLSRSDIVLTLEQAEEFLAGVDPRHTEEVRTALAAEWALVEPSVVLPEPVQEPAAVLPEPATAAEPATVLAKARSLILQTRTQVETGRTEGIPELLDELATGLSQAGGDDAERLLAEVAQIRAAVEAVHAAERRRRATAELDRHLDRAEGDIQWNPADTTTGLRRVAARLDDEDVLAALGPDELAGYRARIAELDGRRAAAVKADALDRALPFVAELERGVAEGLYAGRYPDDDGAEDELRSLAGRARRCLDAADEGDPDIEAVARRVTSAETAIATMVADRQLRERELAVQDRWIILLDGIDDWPAEHDPDPLPLSEPRLPKTREALQRLRHHLAERTEPEGNEVIDAVYRAAADAFERTGARLSVAFGAVLEAAEAQEVPLRGPDLDRPLHLATAARYTFDGTRFLDQNVARAEALHERWQAEAARVMAARQELYDTLATEAETTWPAIVAALAPAPFTPAARPGDTIVLPAVRNRAGWDFSGTELPFSLRYDGTVLAGHYEPHVLEALEHAWYIQKLDVNDRIPWDVVAVVEGPGTVGERTIIPVRDAGTGVEIGKREEWPPVACTRLRIIALHAGPVAVGPPV